MKQLYKTEIIKLLCWDMLFLPAFVDEFVGKFSTADYPKYVS